MELSGVTKMFRSEPPVRPLDGLDLRVGAGEVVAVTGVSGKGKSTAAQRHGRPVAAR